MQIHTHEYFRGCIPLYNCVATHRPAAAYPSTGVVQTRASQVGQGAGRPRAQTARHEGIKGVQEEGEEGRG
jgi:hypothetical protein